MAKQPPPSPVISIAVRTADTFLWCAAILSITLILMNSLREPQRPAMLHKATAPSCDEIYIVGAGETLQTIGDKCNDPFIVERNPHIHDPDDVFPGLVLQIVPIKASS